MAESVDVESCRTDTENEQGEQNSPTSTIVMELPSKLAFKPGWRFYAAFVSLCIVILAAALDATSLSVALPVIASALHGTAIEAFWSGTSFLLGSTVFQPPFAALSHTFGRKPLLLYALVLFTIGSIVAALANNFTSMLVGRSIQGVGGGGIIIVTEVLVTDMVPLRERGKWFGFISMTWAIGSVFGPIVGGAFAQSDLWRFIFWINLPFCALGFVAIPFFLHLQKRHGAITSKLLSIDWIGAVLMTASVTSFLIPVTWGGVVYPWSSWRTLVPLILGVAGVVGFVFFENYLERQPGREPLIPMGIFRRRTANVNYIGTVIHGIVLWCLLYYLPLYYEAVKDFSPLIVGVAIFPETFTVAPAAVIVGIAVSITGRYRWALWSGWILTVGGLGLLYLLSPDTTVPEWVFLNLVPGLGTGLLFSSMTYAIQAASDQKDVGFAAGMFIFMRSFGQSLGVAIGGVIFQSQLKIKLSAYPSLASRAADLSKDASNLVQILKAMPHGPERTNIVNAYADSLKNLWAIMAGLAFVALVLSAWTEGLSLDAELRTEQGFQHEKKSE